MPLVYVMHNKYKTQSRESCTAVLLISAAPEETVVQGLIPDKSQMSSVITVHSFYLLYRSQKQCKVKKGRIELPSFTKIFHGVSIIWRIENLKARKAPPTNDVLCHEAVLASSYAKG